MRFVQQLTNAADLPDEPIPGLPLIEISGRNRVLIEHHAGVIDYSREQICVRVKYGQVSISGGCLELMRMTKEQVIISGKIECVRLVKGEK